MGCVCLTLPCRSSFYLFFWDFFLLGLFYPGALWRFLFCFAGERVLFFCFSPGSGKDPLPFPVGFFCYFSGCLFRLPGQPPRSFLIVFSFFYAGMAPPHEGFSRLISLKSTADFRGVYSDLRWSRFSSFAVDSFICPLLSPPLG